MKLRVAVAVSLCALSIGTPAMALRGSIASDGGEHTTAPEYTTTTTKPEHTTTTKPPHTYPTTTEYVTSTTKPPHETTTTLPATTTTKPPHVTTTVPASTSTSTTISTSTSSSPTTAPTSTSTSTTTSTTTSTVPSTTTTLPMGQFGINVSAVCTDDFLAAISITFPNRPDLDGDSGILDFSDGTSYGPLVFQSNTTVVIPYPASNASPLTLTYRIMGETATATVTYPTDIRCNLGTTTTVPPSTSTTTVPPVTTSTSLPTSTSTVPATTTTVATTTTIPTTTSSTSPTTTVPSTTSPPTTSPPTTLATTTTTQPPSPSTSSTTTEVTTSSTAPPTTVATTTTSSPSTTTTSSPGSTTTSTSTTPSTTTSSTTTSSPSTTLPETFDFAGAATVCVAEVPTIRITFGNALPDLAGVTGTLTMSDVNGNVLSVQPLVYQPGATVDLLYPGTSVNPDGSIDDVPGWILTDDGFWIPDPSDEILRQGINLTYELNPTATAFVTYPPESSACANPDGPFPPDVTPPPGIPNLPPTR